MEAGLFGVQSAFFGLFDIQNSASGLMEKIKISDTCKLVAGNGTAYLFLEHHATTAAGFTNILVPDKYIATLDASCYSMVRMAYNDKHYIGYIMPVRSKDFVTRYQPTSDGWSDMPKGAVISGVVIWSY